MSERSTSTHQTALTLFQPLPSRSSAASNRAVSAPWSSDLGTFLIRDSQRERRIWCAHPRAKQGGHTTKLVDQDTRKFSASSVPVPDRVPAKREKAPLHTLKKRSHLFTGHFFVTSNTGTFKSTSHERLTSSSWDSGSL
jgi:hypothetical protein